MSVRLGLNEIDMLNDACIKWYGEGTKEYYRIKHGNAGSSNTVAILRWRKHYWGHGVIRITTMRSYYTGSDYGEYLLSGHTRPGYGPGLSVSTIKSGTAPFWTSITYPSGQPEGYADLKITIPSYMQYLVHIETYGFHKVLGAGESGASSDMYASSWNASTDRVYIY